MPSLPRTIEVSVPHRGHPRADIHVHHAPSLTPHDRDHRSRIRVTALPRTLLDLASSGSPRRLQQSIERAERLDLLDLRDVDEMLRHRTASREVTRLRQALEIYRDPVFSRARSERLFLDLVKKAGLPRPTLNTFVAGHEIDAYWERERFAVEVDGWDSHRTRAAFEADPLRQEELKLAGIDSIRITARRIEREPQRVAKSLGTLLARRRAEHPS